MLGLRHAAARLLATVVALVLAAAILLGSGALALVWRLGQGPLDVTGLVRQAAAAFAPGVSVGHLTLALAGGALRLEAVDAAFQLPGRPRQSMRALALEVPVAPLLDGQLVVSELTGDGLRLDLGGSGSGSGSGSGTGGGPDPQALLGHLRHVRLTDGQVAAGAGAQPVTVRNLSVDATSAPDGQVQLQATAEVAAGGAAVRAEVDGQYGPAGGTVRFSIPAMNPAVLARAVPALAPGVAMDATLSARGEAAFGPGMALQSASLHAEAGPGTVQLPARNNTTGTAHFAGFSLDADGTASGITLRRFALTLQPPSGNPPTTAVFTGTVDRAQGRFTARVAVTLDRVAFSDLGGIWPAGVGGHARDWLTENITAGIAHDGRAAFTLTGTETGEDVDLTEGTGTVIGDNVTVWWLRPVPPLTRGRAVLTWQKPDTLNIAVGGGQDAGLTVKGGSVDITGLTGHDQVATIHADLAGPLLATVALLKHPRLKLLSTHPLPFTALAGTVAATLDVRLPLESKVTVDDVAIRSAVRLSRVHLGDVLDRYDVEGGQFTLDVTNDGLTASGTGKLAQLPTELKAELDFRAGPPSEVLQHVRATARVNKAGLERLGAATVGLEAGSITATVDYAERRDARSVVRAHADLTEAAFKTPFGWSKTPGTAGSAELEATLLHGRLTALDAARLTAPGLAVVAHSEITAGRPSVVHIQRGDIGRTSATGTIVLPQHPADPYRITLAGPRLDLEGPLNSGSGAGSGGGSSRLPSRPGPPFDLDLRFGRVTFGPQQGLGPVELSAASDGKTVTRAQLSSGGAERARAQLLWHATGRTLQLQVADLGALLKETGLATELSGGQLTLDGTFRDGAPGQPFEGTAELDGFKVLGAPAAGKLLQGLTIYGIVDALRGPGLLFSRLVAPFELRGSVLSVAGARAYSSSLGLTATGRFDFGQETLALDGTIVPAYFFNSLPGRIPLIGKLFSPDTGSGLFAANYSLNGKIADPAVHVNPLSLLTPGIMRDLFPGDRR